MLKAVVAGCGFMGRMHSNVYGALPDAELVGVVDRREDRAAKFASEFGCPAYSTLEEAVSGCNPDVFDICLPTDLHREYTERAASLGKHVFCEKPMALNGSDALAMIHACEQAGVRLMIGHCIRFWPEYELLKRYVDEGTLGRLLSLNLTRYGEFPTWSIDNWLADEARAGGGALDMHIHDTDFALHLAGTPEESYTRGSVDERGVSHIFTTMSYPGTVIHTEGGWNLAPGTPFKMAFRAIFESGSMIMDGCPLTIYRPGAQPEVPQFPRMEAQGGGNISDMGGYYHELAYFVDRVTHDQPLDRCTPESALASLEFTLAEIVAAKRP